MTSRNRKDHFYYCIIRTSKINRDIDGTIE